MVEYIILMGLIPIVLIDSGGTIPHKFSYCYRMINFIIITGV